MGRRLQVAVKRILDLVGSGVGLLVLSPLFLLLAVAIKLDSSGPVFYRQERIGKDQRPFLIYKFRSMVTHAEKMGSGYLVEENDPRITRVGAWLRKTSLDELPQLINVFRGEMSLVGPRPTLQYQVERYNRFQRRRLLTKPGITGWAQVRGRNALTWPQRIELDVWYVDHWSLALDLYILLQTPLALLRTDSIYRDGGPDEISRPATEPAGESDSSGLPGKQEASGNFNPPSTWESSPAAPKFFSQEKEKGEQQNANHLPPLVIIGAGGLGREVLQLVLDINREAPRWNLLGFLDDGAYRQGIDQIMGYPLLGGLIEAPPSRGPWSAGGFSPVHVVCAVGAPYLRRRLSERAQELKYSFATLVHPRALVSSYAHLGEGVMVFPGTIVEPGARVEDHVLLNKNCTVGHDTILETLVTVNPGVNLGGEVRLERESQIGMNAAVIPGCRIGREAFLGAGAVATRDIPPRCTAVGVPARSRKGE